MTTPPLARTSAVTKAAGAGGRRPAEAQSIRPGRLGGSSSAAASSGERGAGLPVLSDPSSAARARSLGAARARGRAPHPGRGVVPPHPARAELVGLTSSSAEWSCLRLLSLSALARRRLRAPGRPADRAAGRPSARSRRPSGWRHPEQRRRASSGPRGPRRPDAPRRAGRAPASPGGGEAHRGTRPSPPTHARRRPEPG